MNLFRLLLLGAALYIVWRLVSVARRAATQQRPPAPRPPPPSAHYEPMARCARCSTYLPAGSLSRAGLCGRCSE
ncbi:hypothetical protein [Solimonas variicoloris]|uniref:hypothetical protein n=1 Tax=Solimonas variicoloris TaxID=254408 RepID=UPI000368D17C|nr:hypothetical protein [Solimonas variicoloris]